MGNFKGHALPGSLFLISGMWWAVKYSLWYATRRNKSAGAARLTTRAAQHRLEIIEGATMLFCSVVGEFHRNLLMITIYLLNNTTSYLDIDINLFVLNAFMCVCVRNASRTVHS